MVHKLFLVCNLLEFLLSGTCKVYVTVTLDFFCFQKLTSAFLFVLNSTVFLNLVIIF